MDEDGLHRAGILPWLAAAARQRAEGWELVPRIDALDRAAGYRALADMLVDAWLLARELQDREEREAAD